MLGYTPESNFADSLAPTRKELRKNKTPHHESKELKLC